MATGTENPRSATGTAINGGFEENAMAILDSTGVKDSRDVLDDKLSFLEAVRAASLLSYSPTAPSRKLFDAIFQILRGSNSLELAIESYQVLNELDKHYPRIYLKIPNNSESKPGSLSSDVGELVVRKEAWSPFCFGSEAGRSEGERTSRNLHYVDALRFCTLIEEIGQAVKRRHSQLLMKHAENMLLFQYLVSVLEMDFLPRHTLYKETLDWILLRESLISMLLGSRRVHFKGLVRDCMSIISERCHHHADISLRDLKDTSTIASSGKTAQYCDVDVALAFTATQLERQTYIAMQRFLTLVMELDVIKKEADTHGLTSRADGLRLPVLDIILDELTYVKDNVSPFLEAFSEPRWKLEIIMQYFSKYCPKAFLSVHHDKEHIANNAEKFGTSTLSHICNGLISAFQTIRKIDENLEIKPFEKEALFTAITIVSRKL